MIIVTGVKGQLGYDVVKELNRRNVPCKGIDIEELDITDREAVFAFMNAERPEAVIHCAAWTAVDKAEDEVDRCSAVNVGGTENIALACREIGAEMMYFSTDYVFSGEGGIAYETTDEKCPKCVYGRTKLEGENKVVENVDRHYIIRISWVFGVNGANFVKTMLRLSETHSELNVVCDQIGSPTYTADLAKLVCDMSGSGKYGVYHATNEGYCSWAEFAMEIFKKAGRNVTVHPIPTSEYPAKAARPLNSRLSKKSLDDAGFARLPSWEDALDRYLKELSECCYA